MPHSKTLWSVSMPRTWRPNPWQTLGTGSLTTWRVSKLKQPSKVSQVQPQSLGPGPTHQLPEGGLPTSQPTGHSGDPLPLNTGSLHQPSPLQLSNPGDLLIPIPESHTLYLVPPASCALHAIRQQPGHTVWLPVASSMPPGKSLTPLWCSMSRMTQKTPRPPPRMRLPLIRRMRKNILMNIHRNIPMLSIK